MPLDVYSAKEWVEEHLDADDYEAEFGKVEEDGSQVSLTISVSPSTAEKIRRAAQEKGVTVSEAIEALIDGAEKLSRASDEEKEGD